MEKELDFNVLKLVRLPLYVISIQVLSPGFDTG